MKSSKDEFTIKLQAAIMWFQIVGGNIEKIQDNIWAINVMKKFLGFFNFSKGILNNKLHKIHRNFNSLKTSIIILNKHWYKINLPNLSHDLKITLFRLPANQCLRHFAILFVYLHLNINIFHERLLSDKPLNLFPDETKFIQFQVLYL